MQQTQKGYSVLKNIPEEKATDNVTASSKLGRHAMLWYWAIFTLIATLVFAWAILMTEFQSSWSSRNREDNDLDLNYDTNWDKLFNFEGEKESSLLGTKVDPGLLLDAADVLEGLTKNSVITGNAWTAWTTVTDTPARHVCKMDDGVENSELDFVVKRITIFRQWSPDTPEITVTTQCSVPSGVKLTGIVALDHWTSGDGASCNIQPTNLTVTLKAQLHRGMHYHILVIGRNSTKNGEKLDSDEIESKSDELFD